MEKKYLPIGSVVLLENSNKRVMIVGFAAKTKDQESKIYDYVGCIFPEGVILPNQNLFFNHNMIKKIFFIGYTDEEDTKFKIELNQIMNNE